MRGSLQWLTSNWRLKLAAFALATMLWVVLASDQVATRWLPVPVDVDVRDPELRLSADAAPQEVDVRFMGPGRELWELALSRPHLTLRLSDVDGEQIFLLEPNMVQVPRGLAVTAQDIRPSSVRLEFEQLESREVPVRLRVSRGVREGYALTDSLAVRPARVRVTGTPAEIQGLDNLFTQPLDLSREEARFTRSVVLDTTGLGAVRVWTPEVQVIGSAEPVTVRTLTDVTVLAPAGTLASPPTTSVTIQGPESLVAELEPEDLRVVVPAGSLPPELPEDGVVRALQIARLPANLQARLDPQSVRVSAAPPVPDSLASTSEVVPDTANAEEVRRR